MRVLAAMACAMCLLAQEAAPPLSLVRGEVLETGDGQFGVRTKKDSEVLWFRFDQHTFFEREGERLQAGILRAGLVVNVVSERRDKPGFAYARLVQVADRQPDAQPATEPRRTLSAGRTWSSWSAFDSLLLPRGRLTFAGIVVRHEDSLLVLRTRKDGQKVFRVRDDTRYRAHGRQAGSGDLGLNTQVFIRAGRGLDNDLEVYEVVWGEILDPR